MRQMLGWMGLITVLFSFTGCASKPASSVKVVSGDTEDGPAAANKTSLAVIERMDLTVAVNQTQKVAAAPVATEFMPETKDIFLIGNFSKVPDDATIEVRWQTAATHKTLATNTVKRDNNDRVFIAHFRSSEEFMALGEYFAVVLVNGEEVGHADFRIFDRRSGGRTRVKELAVSTSVTVQTNEAINPAQSFRRGTRQVVASFFVSGLEVGASIRAKWYHNEEMVDETELECEGEKRYTATFERKNRLEDGEWYVDVVIEGEVFAHRSFFVGGEGVAPEVEEVLLGTKLQKNGLPKAHQKTFAKNTKSIVCGVRLLGFPEDGELEVQWISLADGIEKVVHTSTPEKIGVGDVSAGVVWNPGPTLELGEYMVAIYLGEKRLSELGFEVK